MANVFMWQAGLHLVFDQDPACYEGARRLADGIFTMEYPQNQTFNVNRHTTIAPLLNARRRVLNIAYIHSVAGTGVTAGSMTDCGLRERRDRDSLAGAPSPSWVRPSGLPGDAPADPAVEMIRGGLGRTVATHQIPTEFRRTSDPHGGLARLDQGGTIVGVWGFVLTGNTSHLPLANGKSLAHELGHAIGLQHRGCATPTPTDGAVDGVNHRTGPNNGRGHPWYENVMTYGPAEYAQDLDMIQCQVIRRNGLVRTARP